MKRTLKRTFIIGFFFVMLLEILFASRKRYYVDEYGNYREIQGSHPNIHQQYDPVTLAVSGHPPNTYQLRGSYY